MWRMFWDYGGGLASDWGVHLLDIALWAGDIRKAPEKVLVYAGNTYPEKRARETFDTMTVCYPQNDFVINFDVNAGIQQGAYETPYGIAFIGDRATMVADRSKLQVFPEWDEEGKKPRAEEYKFTGGKESHGEHARNFIDCVKSRNVPACPPEIGRAAAMHVHIPNIAGRTGESMLIWDETKNRFTNSEAANKLIVPEYRNPWKLPEIV
jgi:predicted dehydrogenase